MDFLIKQKENDRQALAKMHMCAKNVNLSEELHKQLQFMARLKELAKVYGHDISQPASNAKEAVQWLYYGYLGAAKEQNGAATSLGRVSTFLDIYIERDLRLGLINESAAQELIDGLVLKLRLIRHLRTNAYNDLFAGDPVWVTMAEAGVAKDKRHMVTKTAYRVLNTLYNLKPSAEPNITVLWSQSLPQNYKNYVAKVSIDTDSLQYENDDIMRPIFGEDYAISCCVSAMKVGKQMQYFGARCNAPKVLLMALNGGRDELSGVQVGPKGEVFENGVLVFDKVWQAYDKYSAWLAKLYVNTMNVIHFMHDKYAYERLMMSLHDTHVQRLMAFGISGLSVLADSLSAIKHARVTAVKDDRGLITSFKTEGDFPKFGNDDNRADELAALLVDDFYKKLKRTKTYRTAKHTLSVLTITSNVVYGKMTGATPCGRPKGAPFAPGANPMHGREQCGALAGLNSVAKLNYRHCLDGISNTFTITPATLGKTQNEQIDRLTALLDGYFSQNAHHLNVNVLNRQTLVDAMNNPQKYPLLTIRVSGYAVNFNKLNKTQQQEVIDRTFHEC
jgi:formate C-acetyltransferase